MQTTRNPSNTQVSREAAAARKRHRFLQEGFRLEEESDRRKGGGEEKRRRRDVDSVQPHGTLRNLTRVRCEMSAGRDRTVHFRDFIAYAWPGDFFGFRDEPVSTAKSRARVDGSQERYTISLATSSASFSALSAPNPALGGFQEYESPVFSSVSFQKLFRMFVVRYDRYAAISALA